MVSCWFSWLSWLSNTRERERTPHSRPAKTWASGHKSRATELDTLGKFQGSDLRRRTRVSCAGLCTCGSLKETRSTARIGQRWQRNLHDGNALGTTPVQHEPYINVWTRPSIYRRTRTDQGDAKQALRKRSLHCRAQSFVVWGMIVQSVPTYHRHFSKPERGRIADRISVDGLRVVLERPRILRD